MLYLICAILMIAMFCTVVALDIAMSIFGKEPMVQSYLVRVLEFFIVLPGVLGTSTLWVAMCYHWYGYNKDGLLSKTFWFLCLFCLGPIAALFYYFFPYRWNFSLNTSDTVCGSSNS